jgi:predicted phosphodiesterase
MILHLLSCTLFGQLDTFFHPVRPIIELEPSNSSLRCVGHDPDQTVQWYIQGAGSVATGDTLGLNNKKYFLNQTIQCGYKHRQTEVLSDAYTIEYLPPIFEGDVQFSFDIEKRDFILCDATAKDSKGNQPTFEYTWRLNDTVLESNEKSLSYTSSLAGQALTCDVTITDPIGLTTSLSGEFTVPQESQLVEGILVATDLIPFDLDWVFWAGKSQPLEWPPTTIPESTDILPLLPEALQISNDKWFFLQNNPNSEFVTEGKWWHGLFAPYSVRDEEEFEAYLPKILATQRKLKRKGLPVYSRTELVDQNELQDLYFAKEFTVEDPEAFKALRAELKFVFGAEVFINGQKVISHQFPDDGQGFAKPYEDIPFWLRMNVGRSDRWQRSWEGLPNVLRKGNNIVAVHIKRQEKDDTPGFYFDLTLKGYDTGLLKEPYLMNPSQNTMSVGWETSQVSKGKVRVCEVNSSDCQTFTSENETTLHIVPMTTLKAGTEYEYTVSYTIGSQQYHVKTHRFKTLPSHSNGYNFYLYGDSRALINRHSHIVQQMVKDSYRDDALFVIHAGDFVNYGYSWDLWNTNFFEAATPLFQELPIIPVPGNHEQNQPYYYDYFDLPHNEAFYTFVQGPAQYFALNTNIAFGPRSEQYKWFEKELQKSTSRWKIAIFHHPPFSCAVARKPGYEKAQKYLVPLMEKYEVDLVLLGHDHLYGRTVPINGVTYVTSGGGGSPLYTAETDAISPVCIQTFHYVRFSIDDKTISWQAIDAQDNIIDEHSLH